MGDSFVPISSCRLRFGLTQRWHGWWINLTSLGFSMRRSKLCGYEPSWLPSTLEWSHFGTICLPLSFSFPSCFRTQSGWLFNGCVLLNGSTGSHLNFVETQAIINSGGISAPSHILRSRKNQNRKHLLRWLREPLCQCCLPDHLHDVPKHQVPRPLQPGMQVLNLRKWKDSCFYV